MWERVSNYQQLAFDMFHSLGDRYKIAISTTCILYRKSINAVCDFALQSLCPSRLMKSDRPKRENQRKNVCLGMLPKIFQETGFHYKRLESRKEGGDVQGSEGTI